MSRYEALAGSYDALTEDVGYRRRAEYLDRIFRRSPSPIRRVADIGCGTGTIACLLAQKGYAVTAADRSEEMLTVAAGKAAELAAPPLFVHQRMEQLRLPEPADAVICTLDALNYLTRPAAVQQTFRRVFAALRPGGLFLFDVNTPFKLRRMAGQLWLDEKETDYCVWRTEFSEKTKVCTYWVDLFACRTDGAWTRSWEEHRERAWEEAELRSWLAEAGFVRVRVTGDLTNRLPRPEEDRWIIRAVRPGRV